MFKVIVSQYRVAPTVDVFDTSVIVGCVHRSPRAAARNLASLIRGRSRSARVARSIVARGFAAQYLIECPDGSKMALVPFRDAYCS